MADFLPLPKGSGINGCASCDYLAPCCFSKVLEDFGDLWWWEGFSQQLSLRPLRGANFRISDDTLGDNGATSTHRALHGHVNRVKLMSGPARAGTRQGGADIGSYVSVTLTARCETLGSHI